jgi:hypothetical protein
LAIVNAKRLTFMRGSVKIIVKLIGVRTVYVVFAENTVAVASMT